MNKPPDTASAKYFILSLLRLVLVVGLLGISSRCVQAQQQIDPENLSTQLPVKKREGVLLPAPSRLITYQITGSKGTEYHRQDTKRIVDFRLLIISPIRSITLSISSSVFS